MVCVARCESERLSVYGVRESVVSSAEFGLLEVVV
tara:strand:+ start:756 stop:860 length:105 start_codon:yes stop_codon:yes gene_type:complete